MITSEFIEFGTHPGTIICVSQIVSIEKLAVAVSGKKCKRYDATGAMATVLYTLNIFLTGRENIELVFDSEAMCTATLKMALTPLTIKKPTLPQRPQNPLSSTVAKPRPPGGPATPVSPAAKPPRKPRAKKGVE